MLRTRSVSSAVRAMIPPPSRAHLRRSRLVNGMLWAMFTGIRSRPHPHAPRYNLFFDGYRNLGWNFGSLADAERAEIAFAGRELERLRPTCVWDVGANVGFWSLYFANVRPPIPTIVCFEPDAVNRALLTRARDRNRIGRMRIRPVALSEAPGAMTFHVDTMTGATGSLESGETFIGQMYGAVATPEVTPVSSVDAEVAAGTPPPQFMKIDVEGHELAVLRGAARTLRDHRPTLIIEVTRNEDELGRLLCDAGYRLVDPHGGGRLVRPEFSTAAIPIHT